MSVIITEQKAMKSVYIFFVFTLSLLASIECCAADIKQLDTIPKDWKIENYFGDRIMLFFTGPSCTHGRLTIPANATVADKNRLWSTIISAKQTQSKVFVRYDLSTDFCEIQSFGMTRVK